MKNKRKLIFTLILAVIMAFGLMACNNDDGIVYENIESITVNEESIDGGFLISEFDISKVKLDVKYKNTVDSMGATVSGEVVTIPAKMSMVKAEDQAKLKVVGTHTITLIYRKYEITFNLVLRENTVKTYSVTFFDENENRLGDIQYVQEGGRAVQPALPSQSGRSFVGWKDRATGLMSTFDNINKNIELQAVFADNAYDVEYYTKVGNTTTKIATVKVPRGADAADYAPEIPNNIIGYSNGRWENLASMKNVNSAGLKFYAVYDADTVQVTFHYMRNGIDSYFERTYNVGAEIQITDFPEPSWKGLKFVEWRINGQPVGESVTVYTEVTFDAHYISIAEGSEFEWGKNGDGFVINKYLGTDDIIVIPDEHADEHGVIRPVVGIKQNAFKDVKVREFVVSDTNAYFVTENNILFNKTKTVLYVYPASKTDNLYVLPETVTEISAYAFGGAKNLETVALNSALETIGDHAFENCTSLGSISIPRAVKSIGEYAFAGDTNLESVLLGNVVDFEIKDKAFEGAERLKGITLPSSLVALGEDVFKGCKSLEYVAVAGGEKFIVINGGLYSWDRDKLYLFPAQYGKSAEHGELKTPELVLPSSCMYIMSGAFTYSKISSVIVTADKITVYAGAFDCPGLSRIVFDGSSEIDIYAGAFLSESLPAIYTKSENVNFRYITGKDNDGEDICGVYGGAHYMTLTGLEEVNDFDGIYIYEVCKYWNGESDDLGIKILGARTPDNEFETSSVNELIIPTTLGINNLNVMEIAPYAFYGDNYIERIVLPSTLTIIGKCAFAEMSRLTEVAFDENSSPYITSIGDAAFKNSANLKSVTFGNMSDLKTYGNGVFEGTEFIKNTAQKGTGEEDQPDDSSDFVIIGNVLVAFTGYRFNVTIPEDIEYIAPSAFSKHGEIMSIVLNNKLKTIFTRAFQRCDGILEIVLPASLKNISPEAFYECKNLISVKVPFSESDDKFGKEAIAEAFKDCNTNNADRTGKKYEAPAFEFSDSEKHKVTYYICTSSDRNIWESVPMTDVITVLKQFEVESNAGYRFAGFYYNVIEEHGNWIFENQVEFPLIFKEDTVMYARMISSSESSFGKSETVADVYRPVEDGYAIEKYNGKDSYVIVPATYLGNSVTKIDAFAFTDTKERKIIDIELPNERDSATGSMRSKIMYIAEDAFSGTTWFKNYSGDFVIIDDFLIKYKGSASVVEIPASIRKVASGAFKNNQTVQKVIISGNISQLPSDVFYGCTALKEVVLPKGLTEIGESAFKGCELLSEINFGDCENLSGISYDAFDGTAWLNSNTDPCVMINSTLFRYQGKSDVLHIFNGVIAIGDRAFAWTDTETDSFDSLKVIYLPQSVRSIGKSAFEGIKFLSEVNLYAGGSNLVTIQERAFKNADCLTNLNLSLAKSLEYIGEEAFYGSGLKSVEIPASLETLEKSAFENCMSLTAVVFASGSKLTEINEYAFAECKSLYKVNFVGQSALLQIGQYAFANCSNLAYFNNQYGVLSKIGEKAFAECKQLKNLIVNDAMLTDIGEGALDGVGYSVGSNGFVVLGNILIRYEGIAEEVEIPKAITTIYNKAFENNINLKKVVFPEDSAITNINSNAFRGCVSLASINFPGTIVFVGDDVVKDTEWFNSKVASGEEFITVSDTLIRYNGAEIKQVVIPEGIRVINKGVFNGSELYDITVAESVAIIREGAFEGINENQRPWSITILAQNPPKLDSHENISAQYIIIPDNENENGDVLEEGMLTNKQLLDLYRLDETWQYFYSDDAQNQKIKNIKKYTVNYVISPNEGEEIEAEKLYGIYGEKPVKTVVTAGRNYIFVGWYFDEAYTVPLEEYPYILKGDISIYAKCIDSTVGSNGDSYILTDNIDGTKTISLYTMYSLDEEGHLNGDSKIVVISMHAGVPITAIGKGLVLDPDPLHNAHEQHYYANGNPAATTDDPGVNYYVYRGAFEGHTELKEIYFTNDCEIKTIGKGAFKNCAGLKKIVLPASVTTIESDAFSGCTSLQEVVFSGDCDGLKIESRAFAGCSALRSITIPKGVVKLEDEAFVGCTLLLDIYSPANIAITLEIGAKPFEIINNMRIHIKADSIGSYSATWSAYANYLVGDLVEETEEEDGGESAEDDTNNTQSTEED